MGKKILLADDSITIQKVIELTFSDEDFDVVTVGNGRLAIEKAQEIVPDVVLCDIIMPEKDGYEVCAFIKKTPALAHIPVLLLTGAFEPFDQDRATRVGCDGFLAKPFEPQTLIAKVKDLLTQTRVGPGPASAPAVVAAPAAAIVEFEPLYALPDEPAAPDDGGFQALEQVTEFEPFETVAFEPVVPAAPSGRRVPASSLADEVAFIPQEPLAHSPAPVGYRAAEPEPVFIPEDDPFASNAAENLLPEEGHALVVEQEPAAATLRPGWARATLEVPLEERARASVAAAYGEPAAESESLEEPSLTLESELESELATQAAATQAFEPAAASEFEGDPLVEMAAETELDSEPMEEPLEEDPLIEMAAETEPGSEPSQEPLEDELAAPSESIFETMGLEQPAESLPEQPVVEGGAQVPAAGPADSGWEQGSLEGLDEMQELAPEPDLEEADLPMSEAAGAVLPEDLSGPVDFDESVGALPKSQPTVPFHAVSVVPEQGPAAEPEAIAAGDLEPAEPEPAAVLLDAGTSDVSFDDVVPVPSAEPVRQPSAAAEVAVPVDMVAQIAQRVVGQISEKVIREIAWEVIPELAEALIKKEIERLKAELQQLPQ